MGKVSQEMADMKTIREADRRWLRLLFGEPYEAKLQSEQDIANIHQWVGTIRQYLDLQELNREIIEELIDRIEVGERTIIDGQRHQDIKIYYCFVGLV